MAEPTAPPKVEHSSAVTLKVPSAQAIVALCLVADLHPCIPWSKKLPDGHKEIEASLAASHLARSGLNKHGSTPCCQFGWLPELPEVLPVEP